MAVTGLSAYSASFEIFVTARVRPNGDPDAGPGGMPGGRGPGGARRSFRFGVQFADGSKVIGQHGPPGRPGTPAPDPGAGPGAPILWPFMAGGGPRSAFWRWWASPCHPPGRWSSPASGPALGLPESRAGLDGQLLLDAAAHSILLWPEHRG